MDITQKVTCKLGTGVMPVEKVSTSVVTCEPVSESNVSNLANDVGRR